MEWDEEEDLAKWSAEQLEQEAQNVKKLLEAQAIKATKAAGSASRRLANLEEAAKRRKVSPGDGTSGTQMQEV